MTTLQFALFFAALLVAYVLVHLRLVKFESYLKEITVLKQLNERLRGVAEAMDRIKVERLEEGLQLLHEDIREVVEIADRVDRNLTGLGRDGESSTAAAASGPASASGRSSTAERVCGAVEDRLSQLGYQKIRVLTDLHDLHLEDEIEIQVECERQMMPFKGRVKSRNGAIMDVDVHSVVGMFP